MHNSCCKDITRRLEHNSIIACSDCIGLMIVFNWDISMFTLQIMIIIGKVSKTLKRNIRSNRDNNFQQNRFSVAWPQHTSQAKQKNVDSLVIFCQSGGTPPPHLAKSWKCLIQSDNFDYRNKLKLNLSFFISTSSSGIYILKWTVCIFSKDMYWNSRRYKYILKFV